MVTDVPVVTVYGGDTVHWPSYTFTDSSENVRNLDIEGWTNWTAQWRASVTAHDALSLTVDASEASEGIIRLLASSDVTEAMNASGVWDLQSENNGIVRTWIRGATKYTRDVTRT
jgi:hypothetical protein